MGFDYEKVEKAWFKPKNEIKLTMTTDVKNFDNLLENIKHYAQYKYVLEELEEWLGNVLKRYIFEISNLSDDLREVIRKEALKCSLHQVELVLDKIQELKKECR